MSEMANTCKATPPKMDKKLWCEFFNSLECTNPHHSPASCGEYVANSTPIPAPAVAACTFSPSRHTLPDLSNSSSTDEANVVILSSDSENESDTLWSNNTKAKGYKRLWEKARFLVFYRLITSNSSAKCAKISPTLMEDQIFPYIKLQEFSDELRRFQQETALNDSELKFLWDNVIQWLTAVKISTDPLDLNFDEKFNLILVDIIIQFVNYQTKTYGNLVIVDEIKKRVAKILQILSVIFNGNNSHIVMTLLRIELKPEYRFILDPIFRKYLTDRSICHTSDDLIVYLRLIFCFKRWKLITPLKTDREKINEIAVKISNGSNNDNFDSILPKSVPKVNIQNQAFVSISDLIGFAIERKAIGTRILLVYTSLDLEEAISKYFHLYEKYINRNVAPALMCSASQRRCAGMLSENKSVPHNYTSNFFIYMHKVLIF